MLLSVLVSAIFGQWPTRGFEKRHQENEGLPVKEIPQFEDLADNEFTVDEGRALRTRRDVSENRHQTNLKKTAEFDLETEMYQWTNFPKEQ